MAIRALFSADPPGPGASAHAKFRSKTNERFRTLQLQPVRERPAESAPSLLAFRSRLVRHQPNEESGSEQPEDRNPRGFEQQKEDEEYRGDQEDEGTHVAGNSNRPTRSALPLRVHQSVATRADCPSHSIRKKPRGSRAFRN
jgi:hypothetical protein